VSPDGAHAVLSVASIAAQGDAGNMKGRERTHSRTGGGVTMAPLWEDVKNAIVEGYVYASDKAEEMTHIGRAKMEIMKLNRQIARTMTDIGGRVYDMFDSGEGEGVGADDKIKESIERIRGYRSEITNWEKEIEKAKAERREQEAASSEATSKKETES
jgi:hypothetical protein